MKFWILWGLVVLTCAAAWVYGLLVLLPPEPELTLTHWEVIEQGDMVKVTDVYFEDGVLHIECTAPAEFAAGITCTVTALEPSPK